MILRTGNQKRWLRRTGIALALVLGTCIARYGVGRVNADRNAIRIYTVKEVPAPPVSFEGTLRLATFNIAHGRGTNDTTNWSNAEDRHERLLQISRLMREHADIVVLNEVDFDASWTAHENQAQFLARHAGYPHVMEQRNFDVSLPFYRLRFGNALLSRFPIRSAQFVKLPPRSDWENRLAGSKQGSLVDIQLNNEVTLRFFVTHLEWRDETTRSQSGEILSPLISESPLPFFCLGDFNCTPTMAAAGSEPVNETTLDTLLRIGGVKAFRSPPLSPDEFTYSSWQPAIGIDWILIPKDWEFDNLDVLDVELSDHRPVFATVRMP